MFQVQKNSYSCKKMRAKMVKAMEKKCGEKSTFPYRSYSVISTPPPLKVNKTK